MANSTQEKLIHAALLIFAEQGYQNATIQQIAARAGTNIAAINYHFGDKATFYGEVISHALANSDCGTQVTFDPTLAPTQQLRAFVYWFINHVVGIGQEQASFLDQIHVQEMTHPSPILDKIVEKFIRPNHNKLRSIIAALLPAEATEQEIRHHAFSVIGQCMHYKIGRPIMQRLYKDIEFTEEYVDKIADHIAEVSLAGLRAAHGTPKCKKN